MIEQTNDNAQKDIVAGFKVTYGSGTEIVADSDGYYNITKAMADAGSIRITPVFKASGNFLLQENEENNLWYGPNQAKTVEFKVADGDSGNEYEYRYNCLPEGAPENVTSMNQPSNTYTGKFNITIDASHYTGNQVVRVYRHRILDGDILSLPVSVTVKYDDTAPALDGDKAYIVVPDGNGGEIEKKISELTDIDPIYVSDAIKNNVKLRLYVKDDGSGITSESKYDTSWSIVTDKGPTYIEQKFTDPMISGGTFTFYDNVKNEASYILSDLTGKIVWDLTPPTATLEFSVFNENDGAFSSTMPVGWKSNQVKIKIIPSDAESGIARVTYKKWDGIETDITKNSSNEFILDCDNGWNKYNFYVYDLAGNKSTTNYQVFIGQNTAEIANESITLSSGTEWNHESFNIKVSAQTIAGFASVQYSFYRDGEATPAKTLTNTISEDNKLEDEIAYPADLGNFKGKVVATITDKSGKTKDVEKSFAYSKDGADIKCTVEPTTWTNQSAKVSFTITDDKTKIQSVSVYVDGTKVKDCTITNPDKLEDYIILDSSSPSAAGTEVKIVAKSNSGKEKECYARVYIDKIAPTVQLSGVANGSLSSKSVGLSILANDSLNLSSVILSGTRIAESNGKAIDLPSIDLTTLAPGGASRVFDDDGIYNITVTAMDAAGNTKTDSITFTIDKTAPVLSITGVTEGSLNKNAVNLTFRSVENFYANNKVTIKVERLIEGLNSESNPSFTSTAVNSTLTQSFNQDGEYTVTMMATDAAGNVATTQTIKFKIDATAPTVKIDGIKNGQITESNVNLTFSVTENNYQTNNVTITIKYVDINGKTTSTNVSGWSNTARTSTLSNLITVAANGSKDGKYTVSVNATDEAGNSTTQSVEFTIDSTAPIIADLSDFGGYFKSFKFDKSLESLITELSAASVKLTLNGVSYDGSEITEDGKYALNLEVTDELGHSSSKTVDFIIDNRPPKVIFAGAQDGDILGKFILNLSLENDKDIFVKVTINGEPYELVDGQTAYDIAFNEYGDYIVVVNTIDEAGNENEQTIKFTCNEDGTTTTTDINPESRKGFLWIFIVAGVVAVGLVVGLIVMNKKNK